MKRGGETETPEVMKNVVAENVNVEGYISDEVPVAGAKHVNILEKSFEQDVLLHFDT